MDKEMPELKPCPFCGGAARFERATQPIDPDDEFLVQGVQIIWIAACESDCNVFVSEPEEAAAAWNRRQYEEQTNG